MRGRFKRSKMSRLKSPRPVRRRETTETSLDPVQSSISVLLRRENELSNKPEVINVCVRLKKPHSRYEDLIQHLDEKYPYKEKIIGFECIDTYEKVKVQDRLSRFRLQKIRALYDDSSKFPGGILSVEIHQIQELQFSSVFTTVLENHGFKVRAKIVNDIKKRSVVGDIQETGLQTRSDSEAVVWETKVRVVERLLVDRKLRRSLELYEFSTQTCDQYRAESLSECRSAVRRPVRCWSGY